MADPAIKAITRLKFEDGKPPLRLLVLLWWPHLGINSKPSWGCGLLLGVLWLSLGPLSDIILTLRSPAKQWCLNNRRCGVRIELAIGSVP